MSGATTNLQLARNKVIKIDV